MVEECQGLLYLKDKYYEKKILKIGITGSAGSGKSLACSRISASGLPVVSCDDIARQVVLPKTPAHEKLVALFGKNTVLPSGHLDRKYLRTRIARSPQDRKKLEDIVQPAVLEELIQQIDAAVEKSLPLVAAEVPLLFELGLEKEFDVSITVAADMEDRVKRIARRDSVTEKQAKALVALHMSQEKKIEKADAVLWNTGSVDDLYRAVDELIYRLSSSGTLV
ncbi:MAG: dephospho-CoA kinase [Thermodesulfobacteriota bacterium]|nr:dephospho-CoA kinase [Thermodesulfobacteriota bacterium]